MMQPNYMNPYGYAGMSGSDDTTVVFIVLILFCCCIFCIFGYFYWKENKEEEEDDSVTCSTITSDQTKCNTTTGCSWNEALLECEDSSTKRRCLENYRVSNNSCLPCPKYTDGPARGQYKSKRASGDEYPGPDTQCILEPCPENYHVVNGECVQCETGKFNPAGDDPKGESDTTCKRDLCLDTQRIVCAPQGEVGECGERCCCVDCGDGFEHHETHTLSPDDVNPDSPDGTAETGRYQCVRVGYGVTRTADTVDKPLCPSGNGIANQGYKVVDGNCVQCDGGKTTFESHDPNRGIDTTCKLPLCDFDQHVTILDGGFSQCSNCLPGEANINKDDPNLIIPTSCNQCAENYYVDSNGTCVSCGNDPVDGSPLLNPNRLDKNGSIIGPEVCKRRTCYNPGDNPNDQFVSEQLVCDTETPMNCSCVACPDDQESIIIHTMSPDDLENNALYSGLSTGCTGTGMGASQQMFLDSIQGLIDSSTPDSFSQQDFENKKIQIEEKLAMSNLPSDFRSEIETKFMNLKSKLSSLPCERDYRVIMSADAEYDDNWNWDSTQRPQCAPCGVGKIGVYPPGIPTDSSETPIEFDINKTHDHTSRNSATVSTECKLLPCNQNQPLVGSYHAHGHRQYHCGLPCEGENQIGAPRRSLGILTGDRHIISPTDAVESDTTTCRSDVANTCETVDESLCGNGYKRISNPEEELCEQDTCVVVEPTPQSPGSQDHQTCCDPNETCGEAGILKEGVFSRITSDAFFLESDASDNPEDYIGKIIKIKYNADWPGGNDGNEIIGKILDYQVSGNQKSITSIEGVCIGTGGTCLSSAETRDECIQSSKRCTFTAGQDAQPGACLRTGRHQLHAQFESMFGSTINCPDYSNRNQCEVTSKQGEWSNISTTESPCFWRWAQNEIQSSCSCNLPTFDGSENRELRPSYIIYSDICPEGYQTNDEAINTLCSGETCDIGDVETQGADFSTCCVSTQATCGNSNAEGEAVTDIQCGPDMIYDPNQSSTSCVGTTCDPENIDADKASCCIQPTEHGVFVTGSSCAGANGWYTARGLGGGEASIHGDRTKYQNGEGYRLTNSNHGGWRWQITHPTWTAGQALNEYVIAFDQNGIPGNSDSFEYPFPPPGLWRESPMASSCNDGGTNSVGSGAYVDSGISLTYHNLPSNQIPSGSCKCTTPSSQYANTCMTRESGSLRNRQDRCPGKTWEQCVGTGAYNISEYRWLGSNAYNLCEWG